MSSIQFNNWQNFPRKFRVGIWIALGLLAFIALAFLFGWIIQFLWNATIAETFGGPAITYWQAMGIFILAKILFGFGVGGGGSSSSRSTKKKREEVPDDPEDVSKLANDESFRNYWREEGREAWEAFRRDGREEPEA